jgi:hypothetical protein
LRKERDQDAPKQKTKKQKKKQKEYKGPYLFELGESCP